MVLWAQMPIAQPLRRRVAEKFERSARGGCWTESSLRRHRERQHPATRLQPVNPIVVPTWQPIGLLPDNAPLRNSAVWQCHEAGVVRRLCSSALAGVVPYAGHEG